MHSSNNSSVFKKKNYGGLWRMYRLSIERVHPINIYNSLWQYANSRQVIFPLSERIMKKQLRWFNYCHAQTADFELLTDEHSSRYPNPITQDSEQNGQLNLDHSPYLPAVLWAGSKSQGSKWEQKPDFPSTIWKLQF